MIILSPSKTVDPKGESHNKDFLYFREKTNKIINILQNLSQEELGNKLKIKNKILEDVYNIYKNFDKLKTYNAINLYSGTAFKALDFQSFDKRDISYSKDNLFILSALYGINNSMDLIKAYRLDMTTNPFSDISFYEFWKNDITKLINDIIDENKQKFLINLCSDEFFKLLNKKEIKYPIINIDFKEEIKGNTKSISTYSKKARGLMSNYIIKNKIYKIDSIKDFNYENYKYSKKYSTDNNFIFTRKGD